MFIFWFKDEILLWQYFKKYNQQDIFVASMSNILLTAKSGEARL